jgi:Mg-chelatase subunit ChlI
MQLSLVLNAINPKIGGVLIRGEKGTAKSTVVRGLVDLLPDIEVVDTCRYGCDPGDMDRMCTECREHVSRGGPLQIMRRKTRVVNLPINATQDRVAGTMDIEHAIKRGEKKFEPGILAEANRGILYVDEVNLLGDHIVDILLDSAAMGVNVVEREGVSYSHPAHFILAGTMNPEEGELRPQLLDRFGLCVDVGGIRDVKQRMDVTKRRIAYDKDPEGFYREWSPQQAELSTRILEARKLLPQVRVPEGIIELIASTTMNLGVDGHRADITMIKTASTIAALHGRKDVVEDDIKEAAELVYSHRMRKRPFEEIAGKEKIMEAIKNCNRQAST